MKRRLLLLFALLASAALLGAEGRLRVLAPPSTSALPLMRLADQDPLPGFDLTCETFISHPQALALLLRGEADLLLTGTSQGWENYLAGGPLVLVDTGVWAVSSMVGPAGAAPLASFAQLAGKRVALPFPGSPLDFQTRCILTRQGLDPDRDLRVIYLAFGQSVPLLLKGQLDAVALPEPTATDLTESRGLSRLLDYGRAWAQVSGGDARSPQVSLFATRAFARGHADLLTRLVELWARASKEVTADPQSAARAHAAALGLAEDVVAKAAGHTTLWVPSFEEDYRRVTEYYEAVKGYLPGERGVLGRDFFVFGGSAP